MKIPITKIMHFSFFRENFFKELILKSKCRIQTILHGLILKGAFIDMSE